MRKIYLHFKLNKNVYIAQKSVFWNMTFSVLYAAQSAIMLISVTRFCGTEAGGTFSIAYATSQLMYYIGSYSCRAFHATDTCYTYSYEDYSNARLITCTIMLLVSIVYCILKKYTIEKVVIVLSACSYKLVEAIEDLDHGELQRKGRLDIAGQVGTLRVLITDIIFCIFLIITRNIAISFIYVTIVTIIIVIIAHKKYKVLFFQMINKKKKTHASKLLMDCFPLFITGFFEVYINNAPKYAIDIYLGNEIQAYFSVIFMPVFTIHLLSAVCFRPQLKNIAELWNKGEFNKFIYFIIRQVVVIVVISVVIIIFGVIFGLYLLGLIYNLSLNMFVFEFVILLLGGSFVALYTYMYNCITIMRKQKALLMLFGIIAVVAWLISDILVSCGGLTGACWSYLLLMFLEAIGGVGLFIKFYVQAIRRQMDP